MSLHKNSVQMGWWLSLFLNQWLWCETNCNCMLINSISICILAHCRWLSFTITSYIILWHNSFRVSLGGNICTPVSCLFPIISEPTISSNPRCHRLKTMCNSLLCRSSQTAINQMGYWQTDPSGDVFSLTCFVRVMQQQKSNAFFIKGLNWIRLLDRDKIWWWWVYLANFLQVVIFVLKYFFLLQISDSVKYGEQEMEFD